MKDARWDPSTTLTVAFLDGDAGVQDRVRRAALLWTTVGRANIRFYFSALAANADVRISFRGAGSWSLLGRHCRNAPPGSATMNFGWLRPSSTDEEVESVVLHEFGHALGLIHEHQNPTKPIEWNEEVVYREVAKDNPSWTRDTIYRNVIQRYEPSTVVATACDATSIMMYPIPATWTKDGFSSGFNTKLSATDIAFIRQCYPF